MLDLHEDAVHAFWDSYDRRTLYRIVVGLENVEYWTLDKHPEIEQLVIALGEALGNGPPNELDEKTMVHLLSNLHAGRALRLLQAIDMMKPGTASQLLMYAEEASQGGAQGQDPNPHAQIFLKRNLVFERLQLLSRVFSPQRIAIILKALEKENA